MIQVLPLYEGWKLNININGTTGTRTYIDNVFPGKTTVPLPSTNEEWNSSWGNLRVDTINISYLGDNTNCAKKYIVNYITDQSSVEEPPGDEQNFPTSINMTSEYQTYFESPQSQKLTIWKWPDGKEAFDVLWKKRDHVETVTVHRQIWDSDITTYLETIIKLVGKVSDSTKNVHNKYFLDTSPGFILFRGAQLEEVITYDSKRSWSTHLTFISRGIKWNYFWRPEKKIFDEPLFNGKSYYSDANLFPLLTIGGSSPIVLPPNPER